MANTAKVTAITHLKARDSTSPALKRMAATARLAARRVQSIGRAFGGATRAASLAAAATGGYMVALKKTADATANRADHFAKFARQVGVSAETLQNLEFVAGRQGASFENMSSGMVAMTKRMGELKSGTGSLRSFLLKSDKAFLAQLESIDDNEAALEAMLVHMSKLPDEQRRMAFAAAAFSRGAGADFVKVTAGGTTEMRKLIKEAKRFRPAMGGGTLKAAEGYADAMFNAKQATLSVRDSLGRSLLPVLTESATKMANWIANNREFINRQTAKIAADFAASLNSINWGQMAQSATDIARAIGAFASFTVDAAQNTGKFFRSMQRQADQFQRSGAGRFLIEALSLGGISPHMDAARAANAAYDRHQRIDDDRAGRTADLRSRAGVIRRDRMQNPRVDLADDAKAHRGFGRTAYGDDGSMRQLQSFVGASVAEIAAQATQIKESIATLHGAVDLNITGRITGASVDTIGTVKRTALVGNVGTNLPSGITGPR